MPSKFLENLPEEVKAAMFSLGAAELQRPPTPPQYRGLKKENQRNEVIAKFGKISIEDQSSKCGILAGRDRIIANERFKTGEYKLAIGLLNSCLRYAPAGSIQIPLAYENRSAVFLEMGKYALALESIDLARKNGFPAMRMAQLDAREEKVRKMMEELGPDKNGEARSFFKLSHPPNKKIPFIAGCLELHKNEKYGRHIITNKDLKTGDIIAIEDPVIAWPNHQLLDFYCSFCLKTRSGSLIPCSHCVTGNTVHDHIYYHFISLFPCSHVLFRTMPRQGCFASSQQNIGRVSQRDAREIGIKNAARGLPYCWRRGRAA